MHPSALPVRTQPHAACMSFQDLLAERLRQAPWFVVSAALHIAVALLLWLLIPPEVRRQLENAVAVLQEEPQAAPPPVELPPPVPEPEPTHDEPVVLEPSQVENPSEPTADSSDHEQPSTLSAFPSLGTNIAVGLGGNAGGPYGRRGGGGRRGSPPTERSIELALRWLRDHQDDDGKWDADGFMKHDDPASPACTGPGNAVHDVGLTGLALLAFLGDGSTLRSGPYREVIRRGVTWLRSQQQDNGLFGTAASHDFVYDHAIAAYAMCEAFGLSNYQLLRPAAQRGLDYLEQHRNPYGVWRYQPRDGDNDTSVTGWCVMAYEAGRHFGLQVNTGALQLAANWLDTVSDPSGMHGYTKAGEPSARKPGDHATRFPVDRGAAMTAVGLFCRYFLGQNPKEKPVMAAAAKLLLQQPPSWDAAAGSIDHYYWYYATYALYQVGGAQWTAWQKRLEPALLKNQHLDAARPNLLGSWDPACAWGDDGGRVYSTAILALCLQANFRYTRLVR
ncbi:MAG: terpene cyclase/mutase family protein [Planctomycetes bacterium]|nr:terpene cyclase/mutase family protein [Planctomycetota bacterium]